MNTPDVGRASGGHRCPNLGHSETPFTAFAKGDEDGTTEYEVVRLAQLM